MKITNEPRKTPYYILVRIPILFDYEVTNINEIEEYGYILWEHHMNGRPHAEMSWTNDVDLADRFDTPKLAIEAFKHVYDTDFLEDLPNKGYHCYLATVQY